MSKICSMLVITMLLFTITPSALADDLADVVEDSQSMEFHVDADFHWLEHKQNAKEFDLGYLSYTLGDSYIKLSDLRFSNDIFYAIGAKRRWNFDGTLQLRESEDNIMLSINFRF